MTTTEVTGCEQGVGTLGPYADCSLWCMGAQRGSSGSSHHKGSEDGRKGASRRARKGVSCFASPGPESRFASEETQPQFWTALWAAAVPCPARMAVTMGRIRKARCMEAGGVYS